MQQAKSEILHKTEALAASHLADLTTNYFSEEYNKYLGEKINKIREDGENIINLDLTHSSIHYKKPTGMPQLQYLFQNEDILKIWDKLRGVAGEDLHFAKIIQSVKYNEEKEIHVLIGGEEKEGYINIPHKVAKKLQNWIKEDLAKIIAENMETSLLNLKNELGEDIERINTQLKSIIEHEYFESSSTLKSLLLSLHLTLYQLENGKSYHCVYTKITDSKYILGSFAGRFEKNINDDDITNIKYFSKGLLSYITYWEGIANYEKNYTKLNPVNDEVKNKVKNIFNDYFHKELIFLDPEKTIEEALTFEDIFQSERTSHKTGKKQQILVVRLFVRSQDAFRFLYCDGAANYIKMEKYLETIIKQISYFNRVRFDVAIADKIPRLDTIYTRTTQLLDIEKAVSQNKITSEGIIYKFYNKYKGLFS